MGSLTNETSRTIADYCLSTMEDLKLDLKKCTAFAGDNTNTNFGGVNRYGDNNVFKKLKDELKKDELLGVGCSAHILHNTMKASCDVLSVDTEVIVAKIFNYFSIYTVRTERLKEFCEYIAVEYQKMLSSSKTRWLSLFPAVERILMLFEVLKDFFLQEKNCPKTILNFFENDLSEAYFWFVHSQLGIVQKQILKVEKEKVSVLEVLAILTATQDMLQERKNANFLTMKLKSLLKKLPENRQELFKRTLQNSIMLQLNILRSGLGLFSSFLRLSGCFSIMSLRGKMWKAALKPSRIALV